MEKVWDFIIEYGIATQSELELITGINGYKLTVLNDVIYYKTGYRSMEQYLDSE